MADDFLQYPKGRIALDGGDLEDVTNFTITTTGTNKIIHTLRKPGAGKFKGPVECKVTFDAALSENGPDRDWLEMLQKGTFKKLRFKVPGITATVIGSVDEHALTCTIDDAGKYSVTYSGKLSR